MKGIWINRNNKTLLNEDVKSIISLKELANALHESNATTIGSLSLT